MSPRRRHWTDSRSTRRHAWAPRGRPWFRGGRTRRLEDARDLAPCALLGEGGASPRRCHVRRLPFGQDLRWGRTVRREPAEPADVVVIANDGIDDTVDRIEANLAAAIVEVLEDPERRKPMMAILRAALTEPEAAPLIREVLFDRLLGPVAARVGGDEPELRAGLVAIHIVGFAVFRHVVGLPPMGRWCRSDWLPSWRR